MKPGRTLQDFILELDAQNNSKQDFLLDTRDLIMDADEHGATLSMNNRKTGEVTLLGVNDIAHTQIGTELGIPKAYYEKMREQNPALLAENVNAWFNNEPKVRMVRTLTTDNSDSRYARAFLSDRYLRIDNADIFETVYPILEGIEGISFESQEVTDQRMYIKVVNKRITKEVKPGDYVQSGLLITNSEVGMGTVTIQPLLYRLVCTNGMVVNDFKSAATRRRHVGRRNIMGDDFVLYADDTLKADNRALMLKIRDTIQHSLDEVHFTNLIDMMHQATEQMITTEHIPEMVQLAASDFGYTKKEGEGILNHLIREGDLSLYGFSNAVTRYAQDVSSYDRSTELEAIGYNILTMPARKWQTLQAVEASVA